MTSLRIRGRGGLPVDAPYVITPATLVSANPGVYRVGVQLTATAPVAGPVGAVVTGPTWLYAADDTAVPGASGLTYTPQAADEGDSIYNGWTITANGQSIPANSPTVGPILSASASAPIVADQTVLFGRNTLVGDGGTAPVNTGGMITSASIDTGTNKAHWQISSAGVITPSASGAGSLSASYTLGCTFTNANGSDTATITITTEANAYDVASTAEMSRASTAIGTGIVTPTRVWVRPGVTLSLTSGSSGTAKAWFDNKNYGAMFTLQSREYWYSGTPAIIDTLGVTGVAWKNITIEGFRWNARYLRETNSVNSYIILIGSGAWGQFILRDNDIAGDGVALGPSIHFRGLFGVANSTALDMTALDIQILGSESISTGNQLKARIHGLWRTNNFVKQGAAVGPAYNLKIQGVDIYDFNLDGLFIGNDWTNVEVDGNYIHSPYTNDYRLVASTQQDDVFVRNTAWTGAADGKKFFFVWSGDWGFAANQQGGSPAVIYSQGAAGASTVKIYRDTSGFIHCDIKDTSGSTAISLQSTTAYGALATAPGTFKMVVAISVDTDRNAQMYIWKEINGGGGFWSQQDLDATSGQTLDLNSGPISMFGLPDKNQKSNIYTTRILLWYGVAPDMSNTTAQQLLKLDDNEIQDSPIAPIIAAYGTPVLQQEGDTPYWNSTTSALGTGGNWDDPGQLEVPHGDCIQTAYNTTVTGHRFTNNILFSDYDASSEYARPDDGAFNYRVMQGIFQEDMNSGHYNTSAVITGNIIVSASAHGLSPYNGKNCTIQGNVCITPPGWGYGSSSYPRIRVLTHGTAPETGGNTITGNFSYQISSAGSGNTTSPNNGGNIDPANYGSYMAAGADPTTRAEIMAYVVGAV